MTSLRHYKPFVMVLLLFGMCSITVNTKTGLSNPSNPLYTSFIVCLFTFVVNCRYNLYVLMPVFHDSRPAISVEVVGIILQRFIISLVHITVCIYFVVRRHNHTEFLNDIVHLNRQLSWAGRDVNKMGIQRLFGSARVHLAKTLVFGSLMVLSDIVLQDKYQFNNERQWLYFNYCFMCTCLFAATLHVANCSSALRIQTDHIIDRLRISDVKVLPSTIRLLQRCGRLKRRFEEMFGFFVLINSIMDFILALVFVYICVITTSIAFVRLHLLGCFMYIYTFVMLPWFRCRVLSASGQSFGHRLERVQRSMCRRRCARSNSLESFVSLFPCRNSLYIDFLCILD